jgi:hypothetical protein
MHVAFVCIQSRFSRLRCVFCCMLRRMSCWLLCISGVRGHKTFYQHYTTSFPLIAKKFFKRLAQLWLGPRRDSSDSRKFRNKKLLKQKRIESCLKHLSFLCYLISFVRRQDHIVGSTNIERKINCIRPTPHVLWFYISQYWRREAMYMHNAKYDVMNFVYVVLQSIAVFMTSPDNGRWIS